VQSVTNSQEHALRDSYLLAILDRQGTFAHLLQATYRFQLAWHYASPVKGPRPCKYCGIVKRVEREPKPAPVKRPRDGPSVACPDLRRFMCRRMPCACVYIRPPSPPTSSSHVEGLNCDPLLREFCAAFAYLNAWQACCVPRPSISSRRTGHRTSPTS
jgi:hypothetical protein